MKVLHVILDNIIFLLVVQVGVNSTDEMAGLEAESGCVTIHEWSKHGVGFLCDRYQESSFIIYRPKI